MQAKPKIIFNLLLLLCLACSQKLVCYTKTKLQSETIYKYFRGVSQGFYIDLNPEQPIVNSNTIYLKSQGWTGVNVLETYAKYSQFVNIRKGQINILGQISQLKQGENSKVKNVAPKINIQQICQNFIKKRLEIYFLSVKHISTLIQSKIWEDQKCKSQLIFIRLNEVKQIQQIHKKNLAQLGYSKVAQDESFILYVLTTQISRYSQKLSQFQASLASNPLVPFSKILQPIKQQSQQPQSQLAGNKIGQRVLVQFSKSKQNVDLHKLISQSKTDYIIVLEFDPRKSQFIVNQDSYQMEKVAYEDGIQFYHVVYRHQGKDKEYHVYVYDHERDTAQGQLRKNNIILQLGDLGKIQAHKYNMSQIQQYNIDNIKRIKDTTQTKQNQTQTQQQKQKKPSSKQQQLQKQIQRLKQKYRKQQQQQKQMQKAREQQKKQLQRLKKQNKSNPTSSSNSSNETREGQHNVAVKKPQKQDIAYLTPQTMFANKQVKNMTIVIIILVICIIGSIMLTAAITAYIMKRRHKRIIAARIKSNAEMVEMHAQAEQRTQDQQGSAVYK